MALESDAESRTLATVRRLLLGILTIGMLGTAADLLLLKHYEDIWQAPPLVLISAGLILLALMWTDPGARTLRMFAGLMGLFILSGFAGLMLHYNGNLEFQREIDPTQSGWTLFMAVMRAKAPPALAPAAMIQLGLIGLLCTYRHPALLRAGRSTYPLPQES
jgi:hypothetical protein